MFECVQDCKRWLRQHGVKSSDEMCYYVDSYRDLFQSSSEQTYNQRFRYAVRKLKASGLEGGSDRRNGAESFSPLAV